MQLYSGQAHQFLDDSMENRLSDKLEQAWFDHFGYKSSQNEVRAWRNSLRAMADVVRMADLSNQGVLVEYQLPMTSRRLDLMLLGNDARGQDRAVIVELKQWDRCEGAAGDCVVTRIGGGNREVLHPSAQVHQYERYLADSHTAFHEGISLSSCAYLHNYRLAPDDVLLQDKYRPYLDASPVYGMSDARRLSTVIQERVGDGPGDDLIARVAASRFRPSKKLMENVHASIRGESRFILLDEQLQVFDKVMTLVRKGFHHRRKHLVLVHGGPGTGKSVLAVNLLGQLAKEGYATHLSTGSGAFTKTLRKIVGKNAANALHYFFSYTQARENDLDVLVLDEAHRIRINSNTRFTPKERRSTRRQVDELMGATKVLVAFIDGHQGIRPDEIGSPELLRDAATKAGATIHEIHLEAQFRCAGSDAFVNWVDNTLGIRRTAHVLWEGDDQFDFQILSSPEEVEAKIREKAEQGFSARMTAGYCWNWSLESEGGELKKDIQIGDYHRPWNANPNIRGLPKHIPPSHYWADDPGGIDQVGCIYTAQGFEFDYAGIIMGPDLVYDWDARNWKGQPGKSFDKSIKKDRGQFTHLVKNTYRVLLSRGLKGCYLYVMDDETRKFIQSRMRM